MGERLPYAQRLLLTMGERLPYAQRLLLPKERDSSMRRGSFSLRKRLPMRRGSFSLRKRAPLCAEASLSP